MTRVVLAILVATAGLASGCGVRDGLFGLGSPFAAQPECTSGDGECFCAGPSCSCSENNCSCAVDDIECGRTQFFVKDELAYACSTRGDAVCLCGDAIDGCGCNIADDREGACDITVAPTGQDQTAGCSTFDLGSGCQCNAGSCLCVDDSCDQIQ